MEYSECLDNSDNFFSRHFETVPKNRNYLMLHTLHNTWSWMLVEKQHHIHTFWYTNIHAKKTPTIKWVSYIFVFNYITILKESKTFYSIYFFLFRRVNIIFCSKFHTAMSSWFWYSFQINVWILSHSSKALMPEHMRVDILSKWFLTIFINDLVSVLERSGAYGSCGVWYRVRIAFAPC